MSKIYVLMHWRPYPYDDFFDEIRTIGFFSKKKLAIEMKNALKTKPGFRDYPSNFYIDVVTLGFIWWQEGYVTIEG